MSKLQEGLLTSSEAPRPRARERHSWKRTACLVLVALALTGWWAANISHGQCRTQSPPHGRMELDNWMHRQEQISFNKILRNIGPAAGAMDGLVIASPSRGEPGQPDYFVRTSSISPSHIDPDRSTPGHEIQL